MKLKKASSQGENSSEIASNFKRELKSGADYGVGDSLGFQLIRATGGREHTVVRALDPGRSSFSCLSLSLVYSVYNIITARRKEALRKGVLNRRNYASLYPSNIH